jgi:hypothetical protein
MTERQLKEQEIQIARYRLLEKEVTDPLAACLLHVIVAELEADLQKERDIEERNRRIGTPS